MTPEQVAEVDQAIAGAQDELDRLVWTMDKLRENRGAEQGVLDLGAMLAKWEPRGNAGLLALACLRLIEAKGGAS